ncbi:MAG: energy-coupling factor transporter transmembrane protein EcfT [Lachnospiraceae bacterium]|nr:energy-coupling factor transporter transmembrane protein EcfT [Lachnospiraceae bacterium]
MLKDITLGQYYPVKSVIHKLDPRVKLFGTLLFIISMFISMNIALYALATVFLVSVIKLSRVPLKFMLRGLKAIIIVLVISVLVHMFTTPGHVILKVWKLTITDTGLRNAAFIFVRLIYLIIGSSIMTLTTTPGNLTDGMEKGLSFLSKIHFPVHDFAMIISIALRFIPILVDETDKIMKAQMARGADFESGGFVKRAKALIPLLVPLLLSAVRRASDLALAMEARCYTGSDKRTKLHPLKYKKRDYIAYLVLFAYLAGCIVTRVLLG